MNGTTDQGASPTPSQLYMPYAAGSGAWPQSTNNILPAQEEPHAPWQARRQLRFYKSDANKKRGHLWTAPWKTTPAVFAPHKYSLLQGTPLASQSALDALADSSNPLGFYPESASLIRQGCNGTLH